MNVNNVKKYEPSDKEKKLVEWVNSKFKQAYVAKAPLMQKWQTYMEAYNGTIFNKESKPDYKSDEISNIVFSTVEAIRPVMTDNDPKFIAMPRTPQGTEFSHDVQVALDYEWERERMSTKLPAQLIPMLVYGTAIWFCQWDGQEGEYGEIKLKAVDPFNVFPDPLAEDVDTCEYLVYATYKNANQLKQIFKDKASAIEGSRITMSELVANRDENDAKEENQVLVLEMWCRDWTTMDELEDGTKTLRYPKGRVITCLPDLGIVLSDKQNPYKDGKFPFVLMKNYDVPFKFWGNGEVEQILSPQKYINDLTNQIIDNAKSTANMQWIIDKNSGIGQGKLTNRPGLVIRKNPGTEVRRDTPPAMPSYVREQIEVLKTDIQDISGVFDALKGERQSGITAGSAIMALQEASQARIRLKIKLMEQSLTHLANMVYSRMQQFWKLDRWVRITDVEGNPSFQQIGVQVLQNDFDMKVVAGSTMPVNRNAMLDLMIRLAQTNAEDGLPMVDRKAILEYLPTSDRKSILDRFEKQRQEQELKAQQEQQMQQQQMQQQQGELDTSVASQVTNSLQEVINALNITGQQVEELMADKEAREKKEYEGKIEEKGYKKGVQEAKKEMLNNDRESINNSNVDNSSSDMSGNVSNGEEIQQLPQEEEMVNKLQAQQIPIDVLEELIALSQEEPSKFAELIQTYPELQEMLKQDIQSMNGGQ